MRLLKKITVWAVLGMLLTGCVAVEEKEPGEYVDNSVDNVDNSSNSNNPDTGKNVDSVDNYVNNSVNTSGSNSTAQNVDNVNNFVDNSDKSTEFPGNILTSTLPLVEIGDKSPVSRALAAKMLSLAFADLNSINMLEREIKFTDCDEGKWYDKYVNAAYVYEIMSGGGEKFMPEEPLLVYQAQLLLDKLDPENEIKMKITDENKDKPISYMLWAELYIKLLANLSASGELKDFGVTETTIIPLATPETNDRLDDGDIITDTGYLSCGGFAMGSFLDKAVSVLKKDGETVVLLAVKDVTPVIRNAYVVSADQNKIKIFSGGAERTYIGANTAKAGEIADVKVNDGAAVEVTPYMETIGGILKRSGEGFVELDGVMYETDKLVKFYSVADGAVKWKSLSAIVAGTDIAEFTVKDGVIIAGVIKKAALPGTIRVAINTTGFAGLVHKSAEFSSDGEFIVKYGVVEKTYKAGDVFKVEASMFADADRIYITARDSGRIAITSVKRNWGEGVSPKYRGVIEVAKEDSGFSIVNEVGIEEYLYAVVPSEMPTSHGLEALKVQAVTARSYAYSQFFSNRYHKYGGNVDDSVSCQVYNNIPENELSVKAVDETKGMCLTYNGNVIAANFFSTSGGMTANSGEVWASGGTFPTGTSGYLTADRQWMDGDFGDLSKEDNAAAFYKNTEIEGFDSGFSWFRWNVYMTVEEIAASVNSAIKSRYNANPRLIKTLQENGGYLSRTVESVGDIIDIEVMKRGVGGNIMQMKIIGSLATVIVTTEYNVRLLIAPVQKIEGKAAVVLKRKDGSEVENYSLMPSAFFVMDKEYEGDKLKGITFYGGGNGHGVGMSQNGVKGMIEEGFTFSEILEHYYKGTSVEVKIK